MVLESIINVNIAEKRPVYLFFLAFVVSTVSMFAAYNLFPESSSVLKIAFITVAFMPILHALYLREEQVEVDENDVPFAFISTHFEVIHIYGWIFLGMMVSFALWTAVLPETAQNCTGAQCILPPKSIVFSEQEKVRYGITGKVIGEQECFSDSTKSFEQCFGLIFMNNLWVLVLAILFSFIWGAGAIFLLGWNASVIGFFIGTEIMQKSLIAGIERGISYLPHGIPEITAYFIAAIAGGIISAAVSKQQFKKHEIRIVILDTILLILLGTIMLFIGAFIETAEIFAYWDAAIGGVIAFIALFFILYFPAVRYRINKLHREQKKLLA